MRYHDIPQFTKESVWDVDMAPPYLLSWIENEQKDCGLILNPDFQRGHVWMKEQQIAYLEFQFRGGKSGRDLYFNCPYWPWLPTGTGYEDYVCVDGLQRITAWAAFLNNEVPVFGHFCNEFTDRFPVGITMKVHINNLKTRKEVLQWYLGLNAGGTPHSREELDRVAKLLEGEAG